MKPPATSTAELYEHLQAALVETMTKAGWMVDPDQPVGSGKSMVAAFQRPISAELAVAAFFDQPFRMVSATRDIGRLSVATWLGVLYDPASRLWPLIFEEVPTPLLAVDALHLDDPQADPVLVTGLSNVPKAVQALTESVLRHGVRYGERYASIDHLVAGLRADAGYGPQFLPVVLAAAGRSDEARRALDELGPRGKVGEDRLDRDTAERLRRWIEDGGELPATVLPPPVRERKPYFPCEDDDHSGCAHVPFTTAIEVLPLSARMVPPEPPELDFTLCQCACHADCSFAGRAGGVGWPDGCSCNETLERRERAKRLPPGDGGLNLSANFGKAFDQARRKRSARRAAALRAKGRNTEEIGTIIDEEWARHGLDRPTGIPRKAETSVITNPPNAIERAVWNARVLKDLIGAPLRFRDLVRDATSHKPGDQEDEKKEQTYEVATGRDRIEVPIDERTRSQLDAVKDEGFLTPSLTRLFAVQIRAGRHDTVELWYHPSSERPAEPFASLSPPYSDRYRRPLAAATRAGQKCTTNAICIHDRYGKWDLQISLPLTQGEEESAAGQ